MIAVQSIRIPKILTRDSPRTDGNAEIGIADGCHHFDRKGGEPPLPNVQFGLGPVPMMACISKYDVWSCLEFTGRAGYFPAPAGFTISAFLAFKGTVGGLVAFAVTPIAVHLALGDTAPIGVHT